MGRVFSWTTPGRHLRQFTDASDHGYGAYWAGRWLSGSWSLPQRRRDIQWRELYAVLVAATAWGAHWARKRLLVHCDNQAVVHIWHTGTTKHKALMCLVRALFYVAVSNNFTVLLQHIAGVDNGIADALSLSVLQVQKPGSRGEPRPHSHPCNVDPHLTRRLHHLQQLGIAPSTQQTYQAGVRCYERFCSLYDVAPWPISELTLRYFCTHTSRSLSHATILVYLAAIRHHHLQLGLGDPLTRQPLLARASRGTRALKEE